jgi:hypothetical protein
MPSQYAVREFALRVFRGWFALASEVFGEMTVTADEVREVSEGRVLGLCLREAIAAAAEMLSIEARAAPLLRAAPAGR